jgi:hypothetical protein
MSQRLSLENLTLSQEHISTLELYASQEQIKALETGVNRGNNVLNSTA